MTSGPFKMGWGTSSSSKFGRERVSVLMVYCESVTMVSSAIIGDDCKATKISASSPFDLIGRGL